MRRSNPTSSSIALWVSALLFLSGATSLAYELLWFRRFAHAFGSSALAMAVVLAAFLLGLGLGARFLGRYADRLRRPMLGYAVCELGIGLFALAVPTAVGGAALGLALLERSLPQLGAFRIVLQSLAAMLVLGPPCVLMGATLPLSVRQLARQGEGLGGTTAWLYAANTLGAAFGVWLVGFHLLPGLGTNGTRALAIGANLFVVIAAVPLSLALPPLSVGSQVERDSALPRMPAGRLALAAGAVGFGTLALEIVWARQLAVVLGGSTYAFTAMLCTALVGIGIGSLLLRRWLARGLDPLRIFGAATLVLALSLLVGQALIPILTEAVGALFERRASPTFNAALASLTSASLELVPCACGGLLFPLLVHLAGGGPPDAGRVVGRVYLWNTVGTAAGAILAHAWLVPSFGTLATLLISLCLFLMAFALVLSAAPPRQRVAGWTLALVTAAVAIVAAPRQDPLVTERGLYVYGRAGFDVLATSNVLHHAEGASTNVLVTEYGNEVSLRVNGKVDASTFVADQVMQLGTAYLPRMLHPDGAEVCVIGYGSGATAGASLQFPGARVVCLEIEPEVFAASEHFARINHSPERSPDFEILFEDGRAFLQRTPRRFDLILTEPSNPWIAGVASLFTREFLQTARKRLAPGGMLGQWIQTYALSPADYRVLLRTLIESFPHLALLRLTSGDSMVLASDEPILSALADVDRAQQLVDSLLPVRADLAVTFDSTDVRVLLARHLVLGTEELRALAHGDGESTLNTDANLRLEFDAPLRLFQREAEPGAAVDGMLLAGVAPSFQRALSEAMGSDRRAAPGFLDLARELAHKGLDERALELVRLALALDPTLPAAVAERLLLDPPSLESLATAAAELIERSSSEGLRLALAYERAGELARARLVFDELVAARPDSLTARALRAKLLISQGERGEAAAELDRLGALDPLHANVRDAVRALRAE